MHLIVKYAKRWVSLDYVKLMASSIQQQKTQNDIIKLQTKSVKHRSRDTDMCVMQKNWKNSFGDTNGIADLRASV